MWKKNIQLTWENDKLSIFSGSGSNIFHSWKDLLNPLQFNGLLPKQSIEGLKQGKRLF